jgi:hypothetical protein
MKKQIVNITVWLCVILMLGFFAWLKSLFTHDDGNRIEPTNFAATLIVKQERIAPKTKISTCPPACGHMIATWDARLRPIRHDDVPRVSWQPE